jgi:hypothetical protein
MHEASDPERELGDLPFKEPPASEGELPLLCSVVPVIVLDRTKCHCSILQARDVVRSADATSRIHWKKDRCDIRSPRLRVISGHGLLYCTPILSELRLR